MRKLIAWNIMTLDGFFEGREPWSLEFHELVFGDELRELSDVQLKEAGLLLFGRKTYEGMASYWTTANEDDTTTGAMNSLPKAVISNTLTKADWNNTTLLKGDGAEQVRALKAQEGNTIYIFGSADLLATLLAEGLVDELRIGIAPVLLGRGTPLFKSQDVQTRLELVSAKGLSNGGVLVIYKPKAG